MRVRSVDVVKGVAIILVVFGHVMQGMAHRSLLTGSGYSITENFIYSFHMPAFFFVAGLFLEHSISRRGKWGFITEKFCTVLYPYLLWEIVALALSPLTQKFVSTPPVSVKTYLARVLIGDNSWFLFTLFFVLVLALLARRIPLTLRFVLAALLSVFWIPVGHHGIDGIFTEYVFVVAGQIVGQKIATIERIRLWLAILAMLVLFCGMLAIVLKAGVVEVPRLLFIPMGLAGTAGLFFLARSLQNTPVSGWMAWFGEASIAIFLLHPFFQGFSRLAVTRGLHTTKAFPQVFIQVTIATLLPAVLYHFRKKLHIGLLFRLPSHPVQSRQDLPPPSQYVPETGFQRESGN
jgi:fucose 4-O-acetylase-like acetyltransferase